MRFLVVDTGLFFEAAKRLAEDGNQVSYYTPWEAHNPRVVDFAVGTGFPNVKKVRNLWETAEESDVVMITDIGFGDLVFSLRREGRMVFGPGLGEELEIDRGAAKARLKEAGILFPRTQVVSGVEEALEYLGQHQGTVHCKISLYRGDMPTFTINSMEQAAETLSQLASQIGPFAKIIPILLEEHVEGVEMETAAFFNGNEFVVPHLVVVENDGNSVGKLTEDSPFKPILKKLTPYLQKVGYRGILGIDAIYNGEQLSVFDFSCRIPDPLGIIFTEFIHDFGALAYSIARGFTQRLCMDEDYYSVVNVHSPGLRTGWLPISVKAGGTVRYRRPARVAKQIYGAPGDTIAVSALGRGESWNDAIEDALDSAGMVNVQDRTFNQDVGQTLSNNYIKPLSTLGVKL